MKLGMGNEVEARAEHSVRWLYAIVLAGVVLGSVFYALKPDLDIWTWTLFRQDFGISASDAGCRVALSKLLVVPLLWMLGAALCGTSLIGTPLTAVMLAFRASALGVVLGELYYLQGACGILTAFLFVMPHAFLTLLLSVLASREAMRFSASVCHTALQGREEVLSVRMYLIRFAVLAMLLSLFALLQMLLLRYCYPLFAKLMVG